MRTLYFDYNSTHPPFLDAIKGNLEIYSDNPANASGISYFSQQNQGKIESSRKSIAADLSKTSSSPIPPTSIHFVSTGTEAIYQLVESVCRNRANLKKVILSPYEHDAMIAACEDVGLQIEFLSAGKSGVVDAAELTNKLSDEISFVSVIAASNESGTIQPITEIAEICSKKNIPLISDCVQVAGKMDFDFSSLSGFAINGHKFGAGYGCAAVVLKNIPAQPIFRGGLQENERRAGTENLFSILNTASALHAQMEALDEKNKRLFVIRDKIESYLKSQCDAIIVAESSARLSNTTYAIFPTLNQMDFMLIALDQEQVVLSTGSSCKSRTRQPSKMLLNMGYSREQAMQALRISTGYFTTEADADEFIERFGRAFQKAR